MLRIVVNVLLLVGISLGVKAQEKGVAYELKLDSVSVLGKRLLKNIGIQKTRLDTVVLHDNIALSLADVLSVHSTVFVKSYGRAT